MLVSVDSRDAENALPKDWSANDIADVEVITDSASGVLGIPDFVHAAFVCDPENFIVFYNKTWALLQTTGGRDEPNIVCMRKSQHGTQSVKTYTRRTQTTKKMSNTNLNDR